MIGKALNEQYKRIDVSFPFLALLRPTPFITDISEKRSKMSDAKSKSPLESSGMDISDYAIERIARCLLSMIREYYESAEKKKHLRIIQYNCSKA